MKPISRIMIAVASLLLGLTFFLPLWKISLWAPQYPEGLVLNIWINKFTGDVQTVNILNHYIGMKPISESSFPELQYFPKIFALLIAIGLLVAVLGKKLGVYFYSTILIVFSIWAMSDFYNWEVKFASDLNPDAAIKMDEMVYQPPLIGEKTLLNIVVSSWPHVAGYAMVLSVLIVFGISLYEFKLSKKHVHSVAPAILALFLMSSCSSGKPEPIQFGKDKCSTCKMTISDKRFGGEVVTQKGKVHKFDSLECMHEHIKKNLDTDSKIYVVDSSQNGALVSSDNVFFMIFPDLRSPMGKGIFAVQNPESFPKTFASGNLPSKQYRWPEIQQELTPSTTSQQ